MDVGLTHIRGGSLQNVGHRFVENEVATNSMEQSPFLLGTRKSFG